MEQLNLQELRKRIGRSRTSDGSPLSMWLSGIISAAEPGNLALKFVVRREMTDQFGHLHVGIVSAMAEEAVALAAHTLDLNVDFESLNQSIQFNEKVGLAEIVTAKASLVLEGVTKIYACCTLHSNSGKLIATARSILSTTSV